MKRHPTPQARVDATQASFALLVFWLVQWTVARALGGVPGTWTFAAAQLPGLTVALLAWWTVGASRLRGDLTPITETTASAAGALAALVALLGCSPAITGGLVHLPAALVAAVLIAATEEVLFRGALLPALARRFGIRLAIAVSAAAFGGLHLHLGYGAGLAGFFAGLALGGLYVRSGLGSCLAFHAVFNVLAGPVFGLSLGGLPWPGMLEPLLMRNPLDFFPVQMVLLLLAVWWAPLGIRRDDRPA